MVKLIGPKVKIIRRLGFLPGLTRKIAKNRIKTPGQHGRILTSKSRRSSLSEEFKQRLIQKQKLRFNYGITENQLYSYYKEAKKQKGATGLNLLRLLEGRLDCIVFRLGFAPTIPAARQLVNHGNILVNGEIVNIPSFQCAKGDLITAKNKENIQLLVKTTLNKQEELRNNIEKRIKKAKLKASRFKNLLPRHLLLDATEIKGEYKNSIRRSEILVKVKDLKVVEYYSR